MAKATEVATPPPPAVAEEQTPVAVDPPGPKTLISLEQLEELDAAESAVQRVERLQSALGVQHYPVNPRTSVWVDFCFGVLKFGRDDAHLPPDKTLCLLTLAHEVYVYSTQPLLQTAPEPESPSKEPVLLSPDEQIEIEEDIHPEENVQAEEHVVVKLVPAIATAPVSAGAYPMVEAVYDKFREKIRRISVVVTTPPQDQSIDDTSSLPAPIAAPFSPTEVAQIVAFFTSTFFRHLRAYQFVSRVPRPCVVRESPLSVETPLRPAALADATLLS